MTQRLEHLFQYLFVSQQEIENALEKASSLSAEAKTLATASQAFDKDRIELESAMTHLLKRKRGFFSSSMRFFGGMPKFVKVGIGLFISVPLFLTGIFAHVGALTMAGVFLGTAYGSNAAVIDHFHERDLETIKTIEEVCKRIVGLLHNTIERLQTLTNELEDCLGIFIEQNERLKIQVDLLKTTVSQLSTVVIQSEDKQQQFYQRLDLFLKNKDATFDSIIARFGKAEEELAKVKAELLLANQQYAKLNTDHQALLIREEQAIGRIEGLAANGQSFFCRQRGIERGVLNAESQLKPGQVLNSGF